MARYPLRPTYEEAVLVTRPVFFMPNGSIDRWEVVKHQAVSNSNNAGRGATGPFRGAFANVFTAATGDNESINVANDASYQPGDTFSLGGWAKCDGSGATMCVVHTGATGFVINYDTNRKPLLAKENTANVFANTNALDTAWHHVLYTKNAGTATVGYVDGVSVAGTFTNQTIITVATQIQQGLGGGNLNDWNGRISGMAIWNRVLTPGEVFSIFEAGQYAT